MNVSQKCADYVKSLLLVKIFCFRNVMIVMTEVRVGCLTAVVQRLFHVAPGIGLWSVIIHTHLLLDHYNRFTTTDLELLTG